MVGFEASKLDRPLSQPHPDGSSDAIGRTFDGQNLLFDLGHQGDDHLGKVPTVGATNLDSI